MTTRPIAGRFRSVRKDQRISWLMERMAGENIRVLSELDEARKPERSAEHQKSGTSGYLMPHAVQSREFH
jgi:hypothetical protein